MTDSKNQKNAKHAQGNHVAQPGSTNVMPASQHAPADSTGSIGNTGSYQAVLPADAEPKRPANKKKIAIILAIVVVVLGGIYGGGAYFFSGHFFPNTAIGDQDLSFQSSDVLASSIQSQVESYSLDIEGDGFSYTVDQDTTGIDIDAVQIAHDATARQNIWLWFVELFQQHDVSDLVVASYNTETLATVLTEQVNAFNETQTASEDASFEFNDEAGIFILVEEVYGTQLNLDSVITKAGESIASLSTTCELTEDDLIKPAVTVSDEGTLTALTSANSLYTSDVALMLNGTVKAATITRTQIAEWLSISAEDHSLVLNQDAITAWVEENTSGLNTVGTTRTWTREDGTVCSVSGGTYGWQVDTSTLATTVYDTLVAGGATSIDITCSQTADVYNGQGSRDWGAYVDIGISEQTVRYYDASGNLLYSCLCVTGNASKGYDTPTGVYYLRAVQGATTLVGEDYETPVSYWMPFIRNSIGLHDATWRSSFGGAIYKTNGSHGCVNLALTDAAWFHSNLYTGLCVIVHD